MTVSRGTLAQPGCAARRYRSPYRASRSDKTRDAILKAALACVSEGLFRPRATEIAARAGVHKSAVTRHFGSVELLYRVIAREHALVVLDAAALHMPKGTFDIRCGRRALAWLLMVGRPQALS